MLRLSTRRPLVWCGAHLPGIAHVGEVGLMSVVFPVGEHTGYKYAYRGDIDGALCITGTVLWKLVADVWLELQSFYLALVALWVPARPI